MIKSRYNRYYTKQLKETFKEDFIQLKQLEIKYQKAKFNLETKLESSNHNNSQRLNEEDILFVKKIRWIQQIN